MLGLLASVGRKSRRLKGRAVLLHSEAVFRGSKKSVLFTSYDRPSVVKFHCGLRLDPFGFIFWAVRPFACWV